MKQIFIDLLFILCFFLAGGCCALVYIEWLKYRFKIIFSKPKANPVQILPVCQEHVICIDEVYVVPQT